MSKDKRVLYLFLYSLLAFLSLCLFIPTSIFRYIILFVLIAYSFLVCLYVKKRKILSIHKKEVAFIMCLITVVYIMLYYLSGIKFGFKGTLYPFSIKSFFENILPTAIIIVCSEIIRYVFVTQEDKQSKAISYVICVMIDFLMAYNIYSFTSLNFAMDIIGLVFFPSITSNIMFHYLSNNYGFLPNIIYRTVLQLYIYIIPVVPFLPESLMSLIKLLMPLVILWFFKLLYHTNKKIIIHKSTLLGDLGFVGLCLLMIFLIMLVSNQFRYGVVVIATDSMKNEISSGDAVIFEKIKANEIILEDQIIVFEKDDSLIIHRVDSIEYIDGELRYYTKGDNNENPDNGFITRNNILGIVKMKVAYVGYPTLWLAELFEKN